MSARNARAGIHMKSKLADALWSLLKTQCLSTISVSDVIEAASVSRGSFYYHFADLDTLVRWALLREVFDSDRQGHPFFLLATKTALPQETHELKRSISRVCLLLDRGGMNIVFDVSLDALVDLWCRVLQPDANELPNEVISQLEYAVGGTVGMLARANVRDESKRRTSVAFIREQQIRMVRSIAAVLHMSPSELMARLAQVEYPVAAA